MVWIGSQWEPIDDRLPTRRQHGDAEMIEDSAATEHGFSAGSVGSDYASSSIHE
jgi:hypothetical protein